jgi:hypothetical protein
MDGCPLRCHSALRMRPHAYSNAVNATIVPTPTSREIT